MKIYRVVRDCIRMPFNPRRFRKDEVIEVEDNVDPGANFVQIDKIPEKEPVSDGAKSLSEMQTEQKNLSDPKSGFASQQETAEQPKKRKRRRTAR